MRKKISYSALGLALVLLLIFFLPSQALRGKVAAFFHLFHRSSLSKVQELELRIQTLQLENARLRSDRQLLDPEIATAQVILRTTQGWKSALWLNVGEKNAPFPLKNAPVLQGDVVVGVIEEVGQKESRVRLISDSLLNPSVRALRQGQLLAKGELVGATKPSFRRPGALLKGEGFNYDFPDSEGPARELTSAIIQPGDLLVTTGFDGVFPKGLKVAKVVQVLPLKEGDYAFDIIAESLAGSLNDLERVQLLPPLR